MIRHPPAWPTSDTPPAHLPGVLLVDDDPTILEFLQRALPPCGFRVWSAQGADHALSMFWQHKGDIDATVLEARLPGCSGPALLACFRKAWGDLPAVFTSLPCGLALAGLDEAPLLPKPFNVTELARLIRREMDRKDHWLGGG